MSTAAEIIQVLSNLVHNAHNKARQSLENSHASAIDTRIRDRTMTKVRDDLFRIIDDIEQAACEERLEALDGRLVAFEDRLLGSQTDASG